LRTEVVSWKDIPQDAKSIVQWHQRLREIQDPQQYSEMEILMYTDEQLSGLAKKYGANYLLMPQSVYDLACSDAEYGKPKFECVYPTEGQKATWVVLKFE
jgi:hypothetical protein